METSSHLQRIAEEAMDTPSDTKQLKSAQGLFRFSSRHREGTLLDQPCIVVQLLV
jgi:hypothetical protein